jgi:hypothetical protein
LSANSSSTQNNSNLTQNRISNVSVVNQDLKGADLQAGSIRLQTAQLYFNASYNPNYGEAVFTGGIVVPIGGRTAYKSVMRISEAEADGAIGNVCVSIRNNGMTQEMVKDLYGKRASRYFRCVGPASSKTVLLTQKAKETSDDRDNTIAGLRAELQQIRDEMAAARAARAQPVPVPEASSIGVPGLW